MDIGLTESDEEDNHSRVILEPNQSRRAKDGDGRQGGGGRQGAEQTRKLAGVQEGEGGCLKCSLDNDYENVSECVRDKGLPLNWTPLGQVKVSRIVRCPHFMGCRVHK